MREKLLKIATWVGLAFIVVVIVMGLYKINFVLETLALLYTLAYAYKKVQNKLIVQIAAVFFVLDFLFLNFSVSDLVIWAIILWAVFPTKSTEE